MSPAEALAHRKRLKEGIVCLTPRGLRCILQNLRDDGKWNCIYEGGDNRCTREKLVLAPELLQPVV